MAETKLMAGHAIRRLRRQMGLTQAAMAELLEISPSYLNLIERNQRPVSAGLILRLIERFDYDPRALAAGEPGGGEKAIRRRLADPIFADLEIDRGEVAEWMAAAPGGAEAFARAYDRIAGTATSAEPGAAATPDPAQAVRAEIERWRGHFADLDAAAEELADTLRQSGGDLYERLAERLRVKHQLSVRILPVEVMPDRLRRIDLHARQVQLSELLDAPARTLALARELGGIEARGSIDALVRGAGLSDRVAERLLRRHLTGYFAAALVMPYARFLRACEGLGYDVELLARRFGAGIEAVAHRMTTLGRVGARGTPFFLLRADRAGQVSKRFAGPGGSPLASGGLCPLWRLFDAFAGGGERVTDLVETEDGGRWFTQSFGVTPQGARSGGVRPRFVVTLGLAADEASALSAARGLDLGGRATPIGLGCRACTRPDCPQRSAAPAGRAMQVSDRETGLTPFGFAGD